MNKTGYRPALGKEDLPVVKPTFTELKKSLRPTNQQPKA